METCTPLPKSIPSGNFIAITVLIYGTNSDFCLNQQIKYLTLRLKLKNWVFLHEHFTLDRTRSEICKKWILIPTKLRFLSADSAAEISCCQQINWDDSEQEPGWVLGMLLLLLLLLPFLSINCGGSPGSEKLLGEYPKRGRCLIPSQMGNQSQWKMAKLMSWAISILAPNYHLRVLKVNSLFPTNSFLISFLLKFSFPYFLLLKTGVIFFLFATETHFFTT